MPKKKPTNDRDRFLLSRNGWFTYSRRVPREFAGIDTRFPLIRTALHTDDLAQARAQRDVLERADDQFWASLTLGADGDHAAKLRQAQATARALGFTYRHTGAILASEGGEVILSRLRALEAAPAASPAAAAILGRVAEPKVTISAAQKLYLEEIAADEIRNKSPNQKKHWFAIKQRAIDSFINEVGDLPIAEIGRDEARRFFDFWRKRVAPATGHPTHSANSANRDLSTLRVLFSEYHRHLGFDDVRNPFEGLSFKEGPERTRPAFSTQWIVSKILTPGPLKRMNPEARAIVFALIETGCRTSELCNITPDRIRLNHPVPHIVIRESLDPSAPREIKTRTSTRHIPLVGVSLAAFQKYPNGFPRYLDREDSLSGALNKFFREKGLFETPEHKIYSFRHAFEDRMKEAGLDFELRKTLFGHGIDRPKYGQGGSLEWRRDELTKLALPFCSTILD